MRNYVEFFYQRVYPSGTVLLGRTQEEADARLLDWQTHNPGSVSEGSGSMYFLLDREKLFAAYRVAEPVWNNLITNDSALVYSRFDGFEYRITGLDDYLRVDSPRGREVRKFRLVPIKR